MFYYFCTLLTHFAFFFRTAIFAFVLFAVLALATTLRAYFLSSFDDDRF